MYPRSGVNVVRCLVCEHENSPEATRCEACDSALTVLDQPDAIERYRRAFERLLVEGTLSERAEKQCEKLRAKLNISEAFHARLLGELEPEEEVDLPVAVALSWIEGKQAHAAILHRGDFTFERIEVAVLTTRLKTLFRHHGTDLDPDERLTFQFPLTEAEAGDEALVDLGVQFQVRAVDITEEVITLRTPLLSLTGGERDLIDLAGAQATPYSSLTERRGLYSLLGGEGWRELPLLEVSEDDYFQWEVQVASARDWRRRSAGGGWRVGDQSQLTIGEAQLNERLCPDGVSWIGAPLGVGRDWEVPAHQVRVFGPIWCGETPVTQALWEEIMGENPSAFSQSDYPVEQVSWWDAIHFCNRLSRRLRLSPVYRIDPETGRVDREPEASGYRLPTEAEWEHLARAGLDRTYAGSNQYSGVSWTLEESELHPQAVAQKTANAWGLYDLCGNVWEWCEDLFKEDCYRSRLGVTTDPRMLNPPLASGVKSPERSRVRRGGSWATPAQACKVFTRADGLPDWKSHFVGLRVVRMERRGVSPSDRLITSESASWAHLHQGLIYLAGVTSSPRREWSVRLEALGVKLTEHEESADVVVLVPPTQQRGKSALFLKLHEVARRARGIGALVLSTEELAPLLEAREAAVHQLDHLGDQWGEFAQKRVMLVGRFRSTQSTLRQRLIDRGVRLTIKVEHADLLVAGGGKLAERRKVEMSAQGGEIINEVECLAILDTPITLEA